MKNIFVIQKGLPIDAEDNRVEVEELHVHVLFFDKNIHAKLWEWLDNYPGTYGKVETYQYNEKSGECTLDIAFGRDDDCKRAIDIVVSGVYSFLANNEIDGAVKPKYPEIC